MSAESVYKPAPGLLNPNQFDMSESQQFFENEWLTAEQAARYLGLSVGALRNSTSNGQIPYYKLGRRVRYLKSELRNLLLQNRRGGANGL